MSPDPPDARAVELARLRTYTQRRHRLVRRLALGTVFTLAMVVLAAGNRDVQAMRESRERSERVAAALAASRERLGAAPMQLPDMGPRTANLIGAYYFNVRYAQTMAGGAVGVCCPRSALRLYVWVDGRYVILYDQGRYVSRWFTEREFQAQAPSLGFESLVED